MIESYWYIIIILAGLFILILIGFLIYHFQQSSLHLPVGSGCTNSDQCDGSLQCIKNICTNPFQPTQPIDTSGPTIGQPCSSQNCVATNCATGTNQAYCSATKVCFCGSGKQKGEECSSESNCRLGLYCDASGVCQDGNPEPVGGICKNDNDCQIGQLCDYNKTCQVGTPTPVESFTNKILRPKIAERPIEDKGSMSLQATTVRFTCKDTKATYNAEANTLNLKLSKIYVDDDGRLTCADPGVSRRLVAHTSSDAETIFFTDFYDNSLRIFRPSIKDACEDDEDFIFYNPRNYDQVTDLTSLEYVRFEIVDS